MAKYRVDLETFTFNNDASGEIIPYKRLVLRSMINGKPVKLEIKLNKDQIVIADMILNSTEDLNVESRKATDEELDDFFKKNKRSASSDKIDLESEDD